MVVFREEASGIWLGREEKLNLLDARAKGKGSYR